MLASALYAVLLVTVPNATERSQATSSLFWDGHAWIVVLPVAIHAVLSGYGLFGNINAWPSSREVRFAGALLGFTIWFWFVLKFFSVGAIAAPGFVLSCVAVYACIGVMVLAVANRPLPGAPGNAGGVGATSGP